MLRSDKCTISSESNNLKRLTYQVEPITLIDYGNFSTTPDYYHYHHLIRDDLDEPAWKFHHALIYLYLGLVW